MSFNSVSQSRSGDYDSDAGQNLFIGNRSNDDRTWDGLIHRVWLYDKVLSETELNDLESVSGNLIESWVLNEGTGTTANAEISSSNDGTLTGVTWETEPKHNLLNNISSGSYAVPVAGLRV